MKRNEDVLFSLVIPLHNEEENIPFLIKELEEVLPSIGPFEVIAVDDGSTDKTFDLLIKEKKEGNRPWLRIIKLKRCYGQSGALSAGFDLARGRYLCMMDGDMQNDPRDLKKMIEILMRGEADVVSGVRQKRMDSFSRKISSKIANSIRDFITGEKVIDSACGIKAFKREAWKDIPRLNSMHRFMPTLFRMRGLKVLHIPVNHRPRKAGKAKYGIRNRAIRGLIDSFGIRWLKSRYVSPEVEKED